MLGERGLILMTVLLLLSLLMIVGLGAVVSVQNDLRMTTNLRAGAVAAYLADAGIEWGKQRIAAATTMPPVLADAMQSLPEGSYAVSFLSSSQTTPLNATIVLRSVGTVRNATQAIHTRIAKTYDLADAAMVLRGNARSMQFGGASFLVSGLDHDLNTGTPITGARPRAAITVGTAGVLNQMDGALGALQRANIVGEDANGAAMAVSQNIPEQDIARIANELCAAQNAVVASVPPSGSLSVSDETWGTRVAPQLRCMAGLPGSGDAVVVTGNTGGAGVLVIRDAELVFLGSFRWEGWIIVSGSDVGFRVVGPDHKEILGGLIIAESGNATGSGPAMLDIQGSLRVGLSRQAFALAAPLVPAAILNASYSAFPFLLKQDYWRSLSP
jgi:Tfp pilus assembly protein PilX